MIFGFFGSMRAGKTMGAVVWSMYLSAITGQEIWSNIPKLSIKYQYFEKWKELRRVRNAIVLFDEIDTTIDSRNWGSGDQIFFTHLFKQMGKLGITLLYTSQRAHMVEKRIRDQTDYRIDCTKNWLRNKLRQDWYDLQTTEIGQLCKTYVITDPTKFYKLYDSFAVIATQMKQEKWNE